MGAEDRYPRIQFDSQAGSLTPYKLHMHTYLLLAEASIDEKSCGITLFTALWGTHNTHTHLSFIHASTPKLHCS